MKELLKKIGFLIDELESEMEDADELKYKRRKPKDEAQITNPYASNYWSGFYSAHKYTREKLIDLYMEFNKEAKDDKV